MLSHSSPSQFSAASYSSSPTPLWKRSLDIFFCTLALPFFGIAFVVVATWLAIVSPGSVFFKQERVGYRGSRFKLYKFRTMRANAETASHRAHFTALMSGNQPMQKLDTRDTRVVPGAWLLRASGIDELPQLLNVLRGEMSLVGPRPCIPYEFENYTPAQRARFDTAPGLTGLWQVSGKNRTTFEEMIRFDIVYGKTKSLWLDLKIVALTIPAICIQIADTHVLRRTARTSNPNPPTARSHA